MQLMPLSQTTSNATIHSLSALPALRRRLYDLGFVPGTRVTRLFHNRGIAAYAVSGSVIALRNADADTILCTPGEECQ